MEAWREKELKGYLLKDRIGSGGFGAVYLAHQSTIGREVAIKIILPGFANHPEFIRRFETEAHLIARLEHPHITPLHDFWRDPEGAYLVMRYLRGGSLREALQNGPYDLESTSRLLDQIAFALDFAHRNDVIHRDIKPANILLDEDGNAYLADFGIAKDLGKLQSNTAADAVVGSLDYISPEQARSEPVTPRTDIYSLGVTLYEMVTGQHPFAEYSSVEKLYKHINDPLPLIDSLPQDVCDRINEVIQTATAKNPENRYPDVLALAAAFREAIGRADTQRGLSIVEQLTLREQEILSLIADGLSNQEIAAKLVVTLTTVKWHITQLYKKLGVRSRVQAIVRARELNLIATGATSGTIADMLPASPSVLLPEPENPYKGLHAFQPADSRDFFGREELTDKLVSRMTEEHPMQRFLAIVGPSGSGKSSLVKAGLIPALWRGALPGSERWFVVDMLPGTHPLDMLETALIRVAANHTSSLGEQLKRDHRGLLRVADIILPGDDTQLLIVVDQFEELFTLVEDESVRQHFLELLRVAVSDVRSRVRVVVTLRADYYDRPLHYPEFGEMLRNRMETVLPLSAKGLERAIRGPSERVGVTFEAGLIAQIVSDMNYQAGALPLLQYALTELFDRREERLLTHAAYQQIGGAVGALANRADEVFTSLTLQSQELARQMFLRLVTLGEGAEDTRRRTPHAELLSLTEQIDVMEEIIDQFAAYRLLSLDHDPDTRQPTVEVAHEAILREWDRLRQWLNASRDDIRQERLLARAAEEWDAHQYDVSYLLRGSRLEQVEKWLQTTELALTPLELRFVTRSVEQRETEQQAEAARIAREAALEQRSRTTLRVLVVVFALAALISGGFGVFALGEQARAERSAAEFRSVALMAGSREALENNQPDVALSLALEAVNMDNPLPATVHNLSTIATSTWIRQRLMVSRSGVPGAEYLPDGERIVTVSVDGRAVIWEIASGQELQSIQRENRLWNLAVHPQGTIITLGGEQGTAYLWNIETDEVTELVDGDGFHNVYEFSYDGSLLLTSSRGGRVNIWDVSTLELVRSFEAREGDAWHLPVRFSPDAALIVTGDNNATIRIWDTETGDLLQTLQHPYLPGSTLGPIVEDVWMLSDGRHLLSGGHSSGPEGVIYLWDWESGEIVWSVEEFGRVHSIALSPDGRWLVTAGGLNVPAQAPPQIQLRDIRTGALIRTYVGHGLHIRTVNYSPDGGTLLTASDDGTVIVWPAFWEGMENVLSVPGWILSLHPTQPLALISGGELPVIMTRFLGLAAVRLVNTDTGEIVWEITYNLPPIDGAITPDGRYLLISYLNADPDMRNNQETHVWDIETRERVRVIYHPRSIVSIAVSPDSRVIAIDEADAGNIIMLWDLHSGEQIGELIANPLELVWDKVFSPDGAFLYSSLWNGTVVQLDMASGEVVRQFEGHPGGIEKIMLNSDGSRLATASYDTTAAVWDTATGRRLFTLQGHRGNLYMAQFSPDDRYIVTSAADSWIILWDAETGEELQRYNAYLRGFRVLFTPDGRIISGSLNQQIMIWDAAPWEEDLMTWAQNNRYIPPFTCEQRELYHIEPLCEAES